MSSNRGKFERNYVSYVILNNGFGEQQMESKTIDLRGLKCPEPLDRVQKELSAVKEGIFLFSADSPSNWNIERYAKKQGMKFEMSRQDEGHYDIKIIKTPYDRPPEGIFKRISKILSAEKTEEKTLLLIIGTDTMGKIEDIGHVLMKGFFETMKVTGELPHTIFFLNAGVRLTTTSAGIIPVLKDIESMGVEIYSCGTCLKYFGLESELKVGFRGTTNHIVEGMKDFGKVIWI